MAKRLTCERNRHRTIGVRIALLSAMSLLLGVTGLICFGSSSNGVAVPIRVGAATSLTAPTTSEATSTSTVPLTGSGAASDEQAIKAALTTGTAPYSAERKQVLSVVVKETTLGTFYGLAGIGGPQTGPYSNMTTPVYAALVVGSIVMGGQAETGNDVTAGWQIVLYGTTKPFATIFEMTNSSLPAVPAFWSAIPDLTAS